MNLFSEYIRLNEFTDPSAGYRYLCQLVASGELCLLWVNHSFIGQSTVKSKLTVFFFILFTKHWFRK